MIIFRCDGTVDGIFSAVFDAWKYEPGDTEIETESECNISLFAEYRDVMTDMNKSERIARFIYKKMGEYAYSMVYGACISSDSDRGTAVLYFIRKGYIMGSEIVNDYADPQIYRVFEMNRKSNREFMHLREFLRFRQQGKFLLAKYESDSYVLSRLADFFSDRLMQENFAIVDISRYKAAIHSSKMKESFFITDVDAKIISDLKYQEEEEEIRLLWDTFEKSIAIESRRNYKLQRQNMPLKFRKYMDVRW